MQTRPIDLLSSISFILNQLWNKTKSDKNDKNLLCIRWCNRSIICILIQHSTWRATSHLVHMGRTFFFQTPHLLWVGPYFISWLRPSYRPELDIGEVRDDLDLQPVSIIQIPSHREKKAELLVSTCGTVTIHLQEMHSVQIWTMGSTKLFCGRRPGCRFKGYTRPDIMSCHVSPSKLVKDVNPTHSIIIGVNNFWLGWTHWLAFCFWPPIAFS